MKNVARLVTTLFVGAGFVAVLRADDPGSQTVTAGDRLNMQDADRTPYAVSHPQTRQSAPSESERKSQQQADAANKDWLLRSYEKLLQQKNAAGGDSNNLYLRIATDKNLSQAAGINPIDATVDPHATLKTGVNPGPQSTLSLHPDSSAPTAKTNPTSSLTPLITPLGAADAAGLHNFYNTVPAAAAPKKAATSPGDLDMPGKIAADSNPLTKASLTFDSLPDESASNKASHRSATFQGDLPTDSDAAKVQKLTNASLMAPGSTKTTVSPNVSPELLQLTEAPPPPKLVVPNVGRQPISSPYSVLDH